MTQRANERGQEPLNNLSTLTSAKTLSDIAMRNRLAEERASSELRMRNISETERLMLMRQLASEGIKVSEDMTMDELARAKRDFLSTSADNQFRAIRAQVKMAKSEQKQAYDRIHSIASQTTMGGIGPEGKARRIEALRTALNDPAARLLPDKVREQLHAVLAEGKDPSTAVQSAVEQMQAFWTGKGWTESTRYANAAQFLQAYTAPLMTSTAESQRVELVGAMKLLDDSTKQVQTLMHDAWNHIGSKGGLLSQNLVDEFTADENHPPNNPADALGDIGGRGSDQFLSTDKGPRPVKSVPTGSTGVRPDAAPVPGAASTRSAFGVPATVSSPAAANAMFNPSGFQPGAIPNPFSKVISDEPSPFEAAQAANAAMRPSPGQIQAFRAATIAQSPRPTMGPQLLVQATPGERMQVENMVRAGLKSKGLDDDAIEQFLSESNQKLAQGDPQAVASANQLLNMVRSAAASPLGNPQAEAAQ